MEGAPSLVPFILVLLLIVLPTLGFYGWVFMQNKALQADVAAKQKELEQYKGVREKVQDLEKRKEEYAARVEQIKSLKEQQGMPVKLMNYLVEVLPEGAWYTKVTTKGQDITAAGKARSIKAISSIYDQLVSTKDFSNIQLTGDVAREMVKEEGIYSFQFKFKYYPGGVKPVDEKDKPKTPAAAPAAPKAAPKPAAGGAKKSEF